MSMKLIIGISDNHHCFRDILQNKIKYHLQKIHLATSLEIYFIWISTRIVSLCQRCLSLMVSEFLVKYVAQRLTLISSTKGKL